MSSLTPAQRSIQDCRQVITYTVYKWYEGELSDDELLDQLRAHRADLRAAMDDRMKEMVTEWTTDDGFVA